MDYNEFKALADSVMKTNKQINYINNIKSGTVVNGKIVVKDEDEEGFKYLLDTCICMTTIAKDNVFKFYDLMSCTSSQISRDKHNLKEKFCENGLNRSMNNRLMKLCRDYDDDLVGFAGRENMGEILLMCDSIDRAEELLEPMTSAYQRMIMHKITRKTLSTPLDPVLLNQMIISFVLLSICKTLYGSFKYNFPCIENARQLSFLKMESQFSQMNKMLLKLDFHDTKMEELKLNINSLVACDEAKSIGDDIIALCLSLDFQRELLLAANPDLNIEPMHHVSLMPSMDKLTLTPDEYKEKYDKMFRYDNAI